MLLEDLESYYQSIQDDLDKIEEYEKISDLDCCDYREQQVLENVYSALQKIISKELQRRSKV